MTYPYSDSANYLPKMSLTVGLVEPGFYKILDVRQSEANLESKEIQIKIVP